MSNAAVNRPGRRGASRLKAVLRRAAECRQKARRALTLALLTAGAAAVPSLAFAQMGQTAMAPTGGIVNRAATSFQNLNANGPGWLYYGINAADRGLGYRGSYMTLGGFIPMAEDDLGGFWAADLRSHLSEYGGFFSNVGAVRKQFIGGTLLGVGVYWDYDGDQNQYSDTFIPVGLGNTATFAGGYTYNQVGISGEWLTDYGNLRSNGYIPVGSTAQLVGPFLGNSLLCVNGINAALGGADLEVGAYIPGLSDWAGMISVGGYALGNTRYSFPDGEAAVPWFGGVYTRLDMTFVNNWDFSLQANNDSYFDWTGFARLTYRMGGSRRRNVPDQMEQPMMRNEHIVRAHQTPEVAINPATGTAWQVFHVDNTAAPGGTGSAETPFSSLSEADGMATSEYDIVYVHTGNSSAATPYITPVGGFTFGATNQYLIGEGSTLVIPTTSCGDRAFFTGSSSSAYPFISNPVGAAIVVEQAGAVVNHVAIVNSPVGISDGTGIAAPGTATIQDVTIEGSGAAGQRGILIANSTGAFAIDNVRLSNLSNDGLVLSAADGRVTLTNSTFAGITGAAIRVSGPSAQAAVSNTRIAGTTGSAVAATGVGSAIALTSGTIADTTGNAVVASGAGSQVQLASMRITDTSGSALSASGAGAVISSTATTITQTGNPAIALAGAGAQVTIDATRVADIEGAGVILSGVDSVFSMQGESRITNATGDGILITSAAGAAFASVTGQSIISNVGGNGIRSDGGSIRFTDSSISNVGEAGILADGVGGTRVVWVQGGSITTAQEGGIVVNNSNLRVEQADPTLLSSQGTTISNVGLYGIEVTANSAVPIASYQVLIDDATISGVTTGILAAASGDALNPPPGPVPTINLTASRNTISTNGGSGINLSAVFDASVGFPGRPLSRVNASITDNQITAGGDTDILLTTAGDTTNWAAPGGGAVVTPAGQRPISIDASSSVDLSNINNGATVTTIFNDSSINFNPALVPPLPPPPPTPP